jgi:hypothetical protein
LQKIEQWQETAADGQRNGDHDDDRDENCPILEQPDVE